jgi:hypothetical protein
MIDSVDISKVDSHLNEAKRILISKGLSNQQISPISDRRSLEPILRSLPARQYKLLKAILDWEVEKLNEV